VRRAVKRRRRLTSLLVAGFLVLAGVSSLLFVSDESFRSRLEREWRSLTREGRRLLGLGKREIPPEERRIREEVILKKMEEASGRQDWRPFAPEYPRPKKLESLPEEEKKKASRNSPEFNKIDREVKEYLRKKEDLFVPEAPLPSPGDAIHPLPPKDEGAERIIEKLLSSREKPPAQKALEENLRLGIKGPLAARPIIEKPAHPQFKVNLEAEIELTLWVLPSGIVDRVVPTVKGDTELERIAIQYLMKWRFVPLPRDQAQVEQWGTIPIKFKLR
jgi:TonB family protein